MDHLEEPVPVRVMVFNVEDGGEYVDLRKVAEAIRLADPDIVLLQEAFGNAGRIAELAGFGFVSVRTQVIARHPIHDRDEGADPVLVEVAPGRVIAVVTIHLPADPCGPDAAAAGALPEAIEALERRIRMPKLERRLPAARTLIDAGVPVVLGGDFNAPSHRDWVEATVGARPHVRVPVAWPVSRAVEEAGLRDTWREIHPDPVTDPGLTWPAFRPPVGVYDPEPDTPADRIDLLFVGGPATVVDCRIAGESDRPDVAVSVDPWPSDHRAVIADLLVLPAAVAGLAGSWPVLAQHVSPPSADPLSADPLPAAATQIALTLPRPVVRVGEPVEVAWSGGLAYRWDWIAIFATPLTGHGRDPLIWRHTGARRAGSLVLDADAALVDQSRAGGRWPLPPGEYVVAYLFDDAPRILATAPFTIVP